MSDLPKRVTINEEGPREGFQSEKKAIPVAEKVRLIEALAETGLKHIACVSYVNPRRVPTMADAEQVAMFGVLGYIFVRLGCEGAPFLLGLVLGPQMEEYFRRAMLLSRGDPMVFIQRPISLGLLITTAILLVLMALPSIKRAREEAFQEEEA